MARAYQSRITVPEYELNGFGELFSSTLVRFLQQVAIEALTDAGFSDAWYREAGTLWLIRRSTIEYLAPVRGGDTLEITTRVADFRRVRSRREYDVRRASNGETAAVAHTDWVYLDRVSGRLSRIPEEMIRGFAPDGELAALPREPLAVPDPPPGAFATERRVAFREIDAMAHVNNAAYVDYLEETLLGALAARGWPLERMVASGGFLRAHRHDVEYLDEARHGDTLRCLSWTGANPGERFTEIARASDGARLTRARSEWQWIDLAPRQAGAIPDAIAEALGSG